MRKKPKHKKFLTFYKFLRDNKYIQSTVCTLYKYNRYRSVNGAIDHSRADNLSNLIPYNNRNDAGFYVSTWTLYLNHVKSRGFTYSEWKKFLFTKK